MTTPNPLPCGCRATRDGSTFNGARAYVAQCPLHAAAAELLAALKEVIRCFDSPNMAWSASRVIVEAAIAKAEPTTAKGE